eukprot:8377377-Lingulodinium_polyedra.AAC.1
MQNDRLHFGALLACAGPCLPMFSPVPRFRFAHGRPLESPRTELRLQTCPLRNLHAAWPRGTVTPADDAP